MIPKDNYLSVALICSSLISFFVSVLSVPLWLILVFLLCTEAIQRAVGIGDDDAAVDDGRRARKTAAGVVLPFYLVGFGIEQVHLTRSGRGDHPIAGDHGRAFDSAARGQLPYFLAGCRIEDIDRLAL